MRAIDSVDGNVIDHDRRPVRANILAQRGADLELPTYLQAKLDFVSYGACDPALVSDTGDSREAQPRRPTDHFENLVDGLERPYRQQIGDEGIGWRGRNGASRR